MNNLIETSLAGTIRGMIWPIMIISVSACAARPDADALTIRHGISEPYRTVTIITATDRQQDPAGIGYTAEMAPRLRFERFTIAIPAAHTTQGKTRSQIQKSHPQKYTVTGREAITAKNMDMNSDTLIYVHGYNYNFHESLFQLAKIVTQGELKESPILFSWPSEGSVTGYVADKNAAIYARDDLVELLDDLKKSRARGKVTLFGHSMGAWLVIESLRQLKLSDRDDVLRRIDQVVLAAPDIDVDLFKRQVETIGTLKRPIIVLNSTDDRALAISSRIGGSRARVGSIGRENATIQELIASRKIKLIDLSTLPTPDKTNHNRFIRLVELLSNSNNKRKMVTLPPRPNPV